MERRIPSLNEFVKESLNENDHIKVLSDEFGGYEDKEFLYKAWRMKSEDLTTLLDTCKSDLKWLNKHSKGLLGAFNRKDAQWVRSRIGFIESIIKRKKTEPDFIPDFLK